MKKYLFLASVAALSFTACTNETEEYVGTGSANQQKEISLFAVAQPNTRAAVPGTTFDVGTSMQVAAFDAGANRTFFGAKEFAKGAAATWVSTPATYWPLSPTTINFLAYANLTAGSAAWNETPASQVVLTMGDNKTAQNDLMFAIGSGTIVQNTDNTLVFPTSVPMVFKHAQAWIQFKVKAQTSTVATALSINSITLNDVSCQGVCTVTQTNYNAVSGQSVAAAWSGYDTYAGNVPAIKKAGYTALSAEWQEFANLMVIPNQGITSFTINYTLADKTYNYTYTITSGTLEQAYKYIYNINFNLHEIEIAPSVEEWTSAPEVNVEVPANKTFAYAAGAVAGTYGVAKAAGSYGCTITGLTAGATYNLTEEVAADWLAEDPASVVADSNGKANIYFTVSANAGIARNANIVLTNSENAENKTKVTVSQAAGN